MSRCVTAAMIPGHQLACRRSFSKISHNPSAVTIGNTRDPSSRTGSPVAVLRDLGSSICMGQPSASNCGAADSAAPRLRVDVALREVFHFQSSYHTGVQTSKNQIHQLKCLPDRLPLGFIKTACWHVCLCHPCPYFLTT